MAEAKVGVREEKRSEWIAKLKEFFRQEPLPYNELVKAAEEEGALAIDFNFLCKFGKSGPELGELLLSEPSLFFDIAEEAVEQIELQNLVKIRISNLPDLVNIRDLRSRHINKFLCVEGVVRKSSEIRPEIVEVVWECPDCGETIVQERKGGFIFRPFQCNCGNRRVFKQIEQKLIDTRWIVVEEPFELTEGERPSQVTILLTEDLVSSDGRRITEPGNKLKINGILREIPKGQAHSVKLDFYLDANYTEPTEIGWERLEISKEDKEKILKLAKDPKIYEKLVGSLAPSLYGLENEKESIVLQLFGGVPRKLPDGTKFRGDIHLLLIGDPASGKSQLLKLVPTIVPRGKYVSGKGVTAAGLTASVSKDEQFMGGWVLEAGAIVLANKGLLSIDEFEKMSPDDQIAMHEAMEQGSVSIAKASIVATLPAQTSVLAGGNPKFSRFDPYMAISKQITIPATLLSRFDLKFALRDMPDESADKRVVDHILKIRESGKGAEPKIPIDFIKKYIAYAKENCKPEITPEVGKTLKTFYINTRKKTESEGGPIAITLRQFEALMRLSEASAKIQLSPVVRKEDAQRAIKLMTYSLVQLGLEPETGKIDVDRSEGGVTSAERSKIRSVLDIINELSQKKKEIPIGEIEELAKKEGIENPEEVIEKLKREGMLFEPTPGYVQKV